MSNQTKGLAALLAAHGRNGDTELVHVTKGEVAALNRLKRGIDGKDLPRNPRTGLHEANFFRNAMPYIKAAAPIIAGGAATALTGGAASPLLVGALAGGATGAGIAAAEGKSGDQVLMGGGLGAIGGVGGAGMASGLGVGAGAGAAETTTATTVPNAVAAPNAFAGEGAGLGGANAFTGTPAPLPGSEAAFGTTGTADVTATQASPFQQGLAEGAKFYNSPTQFADLGGDTAQVTGKNIVGGPQVTTPTTPRAPVSQVEYAPFGGDTAPPKTADTGIKWDYLKTDSAASDTAKIGLGGLGSLSLNQDNLNTSGATDETDKTLPESEVYYTDTGERRTRIVDRPRFGNVNMARGGDVYGDYEGVDEAPDGGYRPGGGLNYAGGGLAGTGWGEQNQGGFAGLTSSLQPGGAVGDWHGRVYGALGADQVMPGGAGGSLIPGANQYNAKKREEEERKRAEQEAGIAAAAKAREAEAFKQKWDDRYSQGFAEGGYTGPRDGDAIRTIMQAQQQERDQQNQLESYRALWPLMAVSGRQNEAADMRAALQADEDKRSPFNSPAIRHIAGYPQQKMADGGIANLGHYSDGGSLLRGPGNGTSDNIPATIEGRKPARLADGEFVVPSRIVSELGNGSTEAGARELYKMMDRVQARRRKTVGKNKIAHDANARSELPA